MSNNDGLLIVALLGLGYLAFSKKPNSSEKAQDSQSNQNMRALKMAELNPLSSGEYSNENALYKAVSESSTTKEALAKVKTELEKAQAQIKESTALSTVDLVKKTSLKSGYGGGSGLSDGNYNISGIKSPVIVRSVRKEDSIAYKKGYI